MIENIERNKNNPIIVLCTNCSSEIHLPRASYIWYKSREIPFFCSGTCKTRYNHKLIKEDKSDNSINKKVVNHWIAVGLTNTQKLKIENLEKLIAGYFNITVEELKSRSRKYIFSIPRNILRYFLYFKLDMSPKEVGNQYGYDRTTIINSIDFVIGQIKINKKFREDISKLELLIG